VKKLSPYDLNLPTLTLNKRHSFDFALDDAFFAAFEQTLILGGNLVAHLDLDRTDRLMTLTFHLTGTVRLTCDRSLEEFDQPIDTTETLHVRFGETNEELADDILQITSDTQILPLAQHLFDYVATALPMKKLHPRFVEADAAADAEAGEAAEKVDVRLIYTASTSDSPDDEDDPADPRWNALRNLN
jgi:uncharacterized protein